MIGDDTEEERATSLRGALYAKTVNLMKTRPQTSAHIHKICGPLQPNYGTKLKVTCEFIIGGKSICSHLDECLTLMAGSEIGELETLGYTFRKSHCNPRARKNNGGNTSLWGRF